MSTILDPATVLFGKTRRAILSLLFTRPDESFYLRELVRRTGCSPGAIQRELAQLVGCGILAVVKGKYFQADTASTVYEPLKRLVVCTIGVADLLRNALEPAAGQVGAAFLFGSFSRGQQVAHSDVDVMIICRNDKLTVEMVATMFAKPQELLGREVNPFVLPSAEFRSKWKAKNHFIRRVVEGEKLFLIGGQDELMRLAQERLVEATRKKPAGNRRLARTGAP